MNHFFFAVFEIRNTFFKIIFSTKKHIMIHESSNKSSVFDGEIMI